ncbi:MarR family transcriptional regulator [Sneathiella chungangensis]|uniref:MarR family transcriptional regulator n=1 Tax=Sneathiella chungangensis TaxID=1418234 RepID=A0A845MBG9_9PROT|nr:MarR family winged helix-turn-helix transcriptional regulator [Sneathiella chungangensis]MZR20800.1 MarR family transcriptional regulator [Sneathiella chungangensis]
MESIESCISFLSGKAAQNIARHSRSRLGQHDITPIQFAVLQAVWEAPGRKASDLTAYLLIDSATITGVIDRLCRIDMLERRPDASDRRANRLFLTPTGAALIGELQAQMDHLNAEVANAFGEDADKLWDLLKRLAAFQPTKGKTAHV